MSHTEFNDEQFSSIYPKGIECHYWTLSRNRILKTELLKHNVQGKKILEIGAGRGIVVEYLRAHGFDCSGVDLAQVPVPQHLESVLFTGTDFTDLSLDFRSSIEVVLLFDVIEHIENPNIFLKKVQEYFPCASQCVITVPARKELWSNYDIYNGHFVRYSMETLDILMRELNWNVVSMQYLFHTLYLPARLLLRTTGKRNTVIHAPKGMNIYVNTIVATLLYLDYRFLPKKIFGTSVLCVADIH